MHSVFERTMRDQVTFVFFVKELDRQVVFQVDDAPIFKTEVEVLLGRSALTCQDQVLRVLAKFVASLEQIMLTVDLHVPCDGINQMLVVVNKVELEKTLDACLVDVLKLNIQTKVEVEGCLGLPVRRDINEGKFGAALGNKVVTVLPRFLQLIEPFD
jgi:hypothetical protein